MSRPAPKLLQKVRALILDVDGVLTDGGMYYGPGGEGLKRFNVKDGMGLRLVGDPDTARRTLANFIMRQHAVSR